MVPSFKIRGILKEKGHQLTMVIPGSGEEYVLVPEKALRFSLKGVPGAIVHFTSSSSENISEMLFVTPSGTFNFKVK